MKRAKPSDFPHLRQVLGGYLHEDFLEEHDSAGAALRAFLGDADAAERKQIATEARRFLDLTQDVEFEAVLTLLHRLGARWAPASRQELAAVLSEIL